MKTKKRSRVHIPDPSDLTLYLFREELKSRKSVAGCLTAVTRPTIPGECVCVGPEPQ